ncbi:MULTISPECIES: Dps family protein [unclassified Vibrio]|uniref:Dps family protein n=1 Tax=Vibrio sp. HB236076 TaxID=3232307 RepID=A0AB39HBV7_9VIBR|nr:Dps family protein [Vibrio sp. HB161653]MDP5253488.1 Dps family protein [Vibrio sp. HB161653]
MSSESNMIGLDQEKVNVLAKELNHLLALYQVQYMNTRGYHWNVKGEQFFELHAKFEEIYTDLLTQVDEIAERILTLGHVPDHAFTRYVEVSEIKEAINVSNGKECVKGLVEGFSTLIQKERVILGLAGEADDEGTAAQMGDYIREQEKLLWMLNAYLH